MSQATRAVIYARISSDPEGLRAGVERQIEDCAALAERLGWELHPDHLPALIDNDISASGRSRSVRPGFERLVDGVRRGEFDGILYYSNSRLTRRPMEYETIIQLVADTGVRLASVVSGTVDLTTADGRMIGRILAAQDAAEAERIGERITRAFRQRREVDRLPSPANRSFGFEKGGIVVVPDEARAIREGVDMLLNGASLGDVARRWNATGVKPIRAQQWNVATVRNALIKPRNAGLIVTNGENLGRGNFEAIISPETHEAMLRALKARSSVMRMRHKGRANLLAGYLWCGACGRPMSINARRNEDGSLSRHARVACSVAQYGCGKLSRNLLSLQAYVFEVVEAALVSASENGEQVSEVVDRARALAAVNAQIESLERDMGLVRKEFGARRMGSADFLSTTRVLRERVEALEAEASALDAPEVVVRPGDALAMWREGTFEERRAVLATVLDSIVLRPIGRVGPAKARLAIPESTEIKLR